MSKGKLQQLIFNKKNIVIATIFLVCLIGIILIRKSFALTETPSVEIPTISPSYSSKEQGSANATNSAKWLSNDTVEVTMDVDTVAKKQDNITSKDTVLIIDTSLSMTEEKLAKVKEDAKEIISKVDDNNKMSIITFNSEAGLNTGLTSNKTNLNNIINSLIGTGGSNYYAAFNTLNTFLKSYQKEDNKDLNVIFLAGSEANVNHPADETLIKVLKEQYNYLKINGIQYCLGNTQLDSLKSITDTLNVYSSTMDNNIFEKALVSGNYKYESLVLTDIINNEYFIVENASDISVNMGNIELKTDSSNNLNVVWTISKDDQYTGLTAKMTMKLKLKDAYLNVGGLYSINDEVDIVSKISGVSNTTKSNLSPVLAKEAHAVTYNGNVPTGCTISNVPENESHLPYEVVRINNSKIPVCEGYLFKGWTITNSDTKLSTLTSFKMPNNNVELKASWGKVSIAKSANGSVYTYKEEPLSTKLKKDNSLETNGAIDTTDVDQTFITGEDPNNYVWYSGKLWRAVSIDTEDNSVKLVTQWNISTIEYNPSGNTAFEGSDIEDWLNNTDEDGFLGTLYDYQNYIKVDSKWNATLVPSGSESTRPAETTMVTDAVGLLNIYEYTKSYTGTTEANGYLNNGQRWWTNSPDGTSFVWKINYYGNAQSSGVPYFDMLGVRPSINLKSDVLVVDGDGSENNPYKLKGDNSATANDKLNTRKSGEYVKFNDDLYRIVNMQGDKTKIIAIHSVVNKEFDSDPYPNAKIYDPTRSVNIGYYLNNDWYNSLTSTSRNMLDVGTWYIGYIDSNLNYKASKDTTENASINVKVGLIRYGELMSGQFDKMYFNFKWIITPTHSFQGYVITNEGTITSLYKHYQKNINPSVYLKANVHITSGIGLPDDPYILNQ